MTLQRCKVLDRVAEVGFWCDQDGESSLVFWNGFGLRNPAVELGVPYGAGAETDAS